MRHVRQIVIAGLLLCTGCFTTKVRTAAAADGQERDRRQVFTLGGLVPLSTPNAGECKYGVARADSSVGPIDILVWVGTSVAGALIGAAACGSSNGGLACASAGASLAPFAFATRTVSYQCATPPPPLALQSTESKERVSPPPRAPIEAPTDNSVAGRLARLDKMLQAGAITPAEHAEQRKKILDEL